ncbi:MAG: FHA domain-containing protein [Deltaproteobacteria bacterium]|nr:FHA domain-containing protein [Deltaproteobacteria bacterium]
MARRLRAAGGPLEGKTFVLGRRTVIGRSSDADIQIVDSKISRQHACLLEDDDGKMILLDLSSRNGTVVGDRSVGRHDLQPGDSIQIGDSRFVYEVLQASFEPVLLPSPEDPEDGPTETVRALASSPMSIQTDPSLCVSPLHQAAIERQWPYCPICGRHP